MNAGNHALRIIIIIIIIIIIVLTNTFAHAELKRNASNIHLLKHQGGDIARSK